MTNTCSNNEISVEKETDNNQNVVENDNTDNNDNNQFIYIIVFEMVFYENKKRSNRNN